VVIVKMPNIFTNEEYADMHFVYGFCNGNGRAAAVEYQQCRIRQCKAFENVHGTLRETGSFP
jgi:hypothetical protein